MFKNLIIILFLLSLKLNSKSWTIKYSGYGEIFDKLKLTDGSTTALYKNKGTWEDNLGNDAIRNCIGLIELNSNNSLIKGQFFCEATDNENNKYVFRGIRGDNKMDAGLGKMTLIDGNGKWKNLVGAKCTYAIRYQKDALFQVDNCQKN